MFQLKHRAVNALFAAAGLTVMCTFPCWSAADSLMAEPKSYDIDYYHGGRLPWIEDLVARIYSDWAPSENLDDLSVTVSLAVAPDGKLYDVRVSKTSGDRQLDADCVQAVLASAAFKPNTGLVEGELHHFAITFDATKKARYQHSGISEYWKSHPEQKDGFVGVYRIPLDVLKRYPGLFDENELLDVSNVGFISDVERELSPGLDSMALYRLQFIYSGTWIPFFIQHPSATRKEILEVRNRLPFYNGQDRLPDFS